MAASAEATEEAATVESGVPLDTIPMAETTMSEGELQEKKTDIQSSERALGPQLRSPPRCPLVEGLSEGHVVARDSS